MINYEGKGLLVASNWLVDAGNVATERNGSSSNLSRILYSR
jgi:hypothetical protein